MNLRLLLFILLIVISCSKMEESRSQNEITDYSFTPEKELFAQLLLNKRLTNLDSIFRTPQAITLLASNNKSSLDFSDSNFYRKNTRNSPKKKLNTKVSDSIELISPSEIIDHAFKNSRVVMMNEGHAGAKRNIRTRIIGKTILTKAHSHGVRYLAMEALYPEFAKKANKTTNVPEAEDRWVYLNQPEMRDFIQAALDLGWTLIAYEADLSTMPKFNNPIDQSNWREEEQANNLVKALNSIGENEKLLVWCGNNHHEKEKGVIGNQAFYPMGYQFWKKTKIEPFVVDQIVTLNFSGENKRYQKWSQYEEVLKKDFYGTLGFLNKNKNKYATIISIFNSLQ